MLKISNFTKFKSEKVESNKQKVQRNLTFFKYLRRGKFKALKFGKYLKCNALGI